MEALSPILQAVLPPFAIIAVGYLLRKYRRLQSDALVHVAMSVAAPCLAFSVLTAHDVTGEEVWGIAVSAAAVVFGSGVLGWIALRVAGIRSRGLLLPIMFMNSANLPFPITFFLWGDEGLARAVIYYTVIATLLFTIGIAIASGRAGWKRVSSEPLIWATAAAFALNALHWTVPTTLDRGIDLMGDAAIPLILLLLGMQLEGIRIDSIGGATLAASVRIVGGFVLGVALAALLHLEGRARDIVILCSGMPPAMITAAISMRYRADPERVAAAVLLGTIASLVVLPLILLYLQA